MDDIKLTTVKVLTKLYNEFKHKTLEDDLLCKNL